MECAQAGSGCTRACPHDSEHDGRCACSDAFAFLHVRVGHLAQLCARRCPHWSCRLGWVTGGIWCSMLAVFVPWLRIAPLRYHASGRQQTEAVAAGVFLFLAVLSAVVAFVGFSLSPRLLRRRANISARLVTDVSAQEGLLEVLAGE